MPSAWTARLRPQPTAHPQLVHVPTRTCVLSLEKQQGSVALQGATGTVTDARTPSVAHASAHLCHRLTPHSVFPSVFPAPRAVGPAARTPPYPPPPHILCSPPSSAPSPSTAPPPPPLRGLPRSSCAMDYRHTWWSGRFPVGTRVRVSSRSGSWVVGYIPRHATPEVAAFACRLLPNRVLVRVPPGVVRMFRSKRVSFVPLLPERRVRCHLRAPTWSSSSSSASSSSVEAWSHPSRVQGVISEEGGGDDNGMEEAPGAARNENSQSASTV